MLERARYVLWGSGGHAKVLAETIALRQGRVIALFDNREVPSALSGAPVFIGEQGFRQWLSSTNDVQSIHGLVAIGGVRGRDRIAMLELFLRAGLDVPTLVSPTAFVSDTAKLGGGTQVLPLGLVGAEAKLGRACIVNHRASVDHECVLGDGVHIAPSATLCGCVRVEDGAFIGAAAVVLPRVRIGPDAVVGAGAVVTRDVSASATVVGNPARVIGRGRKPPELLELRED
jgi:sugar O-acyltransferase (sialic acid O-acetyltransferase NeuD family)